jgi:uncharacterized membrane protein
MWNTVIEKPQRSILKAVSWRITGSIDTTVVSWLITGKFTVAITIGSVEVFTKIVLYFFHERIWDRIEYGRRSSNPPEYNI